MSCLERVLEETQNQAKSTKETQTEIAKLKQGLIEVIEEVHEMAALRQSAAQEVCDVKNVLKEIAELKQMLAEQKTV